MPKDKTQSHLLILKMAKEDFLRQGYEKTSMRQVARRAGLTGGALYKHFSGREEMFHALIDPVYQGMIRLYQKQTKRAKDILLSQGLEAFTEDSTDITMLILEFIYQYFEEFQLMFRAPKESKYFHIRERMVELEIESSKEIAKALGRNGIKDIVSDELMHIFFTMSLTPLFEVIEHGYPYEKAAKIVEKISKVQNYAWQKLIKENNE